MTVSIRPLRIEDAYTSVKWRNDPEVFRYTGNTYDHNITIESELAWIKRVISKEDDYRCAIEVDGIYVGNIYLTDIHDGKAEYHIFIGNKEYWGKGIAKEASLLIIKYAQDILNLNKIILEVNEKNIRAVKLYKSLGFVEEHQKDSVSHMCLEMKGINEILVAIHCLVYNHEPYLCDCFEGFVMQNTNFRFVAIVHDDASTDKSADIIREYAKKYPDIIKPIFETENQYSKQDGSLGRIMNEAINTTGAKYIALCEGDDYWTDPYKLQKQVDFLEAHPDFSMCFHSAEIKNETNTNQIITCDRIEEREYFTNDIFPGWVIPTASVVYRRTMIDTFPPLKHEEWMKYGNIVLFLKCTHTGRVWGMKDVMSVYRMTNNGAVIKQNVDPKTRYKLMLHYRFLMENFPELDKQWLNAYIATYNYTQFRTSTKFGHKLISLARAFYYSPKYVIRILFKMHPHGTY